MAALKTLGDGLYAAVLVVKVEKMLSTHDDGATIAMMSTASWLTPAILEKLKNFVESFFGSDNGKIPDMYKDVITLLTSDTDANSAQPDNIYFILERILVVSNFLSHTLSIFQPFSLCLLLFVPINSIWVRCC